MNPTDPTTPQPKPADAAGLLPLISRGSTIVDASGRAVADAYTEPNALLLVEMLNRPLPTPHAAEAGVRDGDAIKAAAKEIHGLIFNGSGKREDWQYLKAKDIATNIEGHLAARHRTAAETVGTGGRCQLCKVPLTDYGSHYFHPYSSDCTNGGKDMAKPATPPATQSALEQAREALEALAAKWRSEAAHVRSHYDNKMASVFEACADHLTAALNAVLPPAKGGDGK